MYEVHVPRILYSILRNDTTVCRGRLAKQQRPSRFLFQRSRDLANCPSARSGLLHLGWRGATSNDSETALCYTKMPARPSQHMAVSDPEHNHCCQTLPRHPEVVLGDGAVVSEPSAREGSNPIGTSKGDGDGPIRKTHCLAGATDAAEWQFRWANIRLQPDSKGELDASQPCPAPRKSSTAEDHHSSGRARAES